MTIPPAMPWVKLHTSYLDDSRFARLDDGQKFRFFQLLMLAGKLDAGGYFTEHGQELTEEEIAWKLRLQAELLRTDLHALSKAGLTHKNGRGWCIPDFEEEQGPTQAIKRAAWKERQKKHREGHVIVTRDKLVTNPLFTPLESESESESESDKEIESESESESSSRSATKADAAAEVVLIFKALGASPEQLKYLSETKGIQKNDIWAMAARMWQDNKVHKPAWLTMQNILAGEKASADWYDESLWSTIPEKIRRAGGLVIQSQEEQENQQALVAIRNSKPDETVTEKVQQWWQSVREELRGEMNKAAFNTWVQDTYPIHYGDGLILIDARNKIACEWLEQRLTSTATRLLCGIANQNIAIQFVVGMENSL